MTGKINLIFMGGFTYPYGMAGTKRIQHAIKALKNYPEVSVRVIVLRQSGRDNTLSGVHEGTPYQTVMGNVSRAKTAVSLPMLHFKTIQILKDAWLPNCKNIIYYYGPTDLENLVPLYYGRHLGFKIAFDIVEDYDTVKDKSGSFYYRFRIGCFGMLSSRMHALASGFVVISSHLEKKYRELGQGRTPIHHRPISVDMDHFPPGPSRMNSMVSLFYAGSFGRKKDGLSVLLDAFDRLAESRKNVRLVLTGKGDSGSMNSFFSRVEASLHKERIDYMGYLDDKDYFSALNSSDIPCMTRIDSEYTNAGFPFKLGEFLAAGKPVIASRVSDVGSFLENRHSAMLVMPGDSSEIFEAAEYLLDNPEHAAVIGARGRDVAISFFDYRQQGETLLSFLKNI